MFVFVQDQRLLESISLSIKTPGGLPGLKSCVGMFYFIFNPSHVVMTLPPCCVSASNPLVSPRGGVVAVWAPFEHRYDLETRAGCLPFAIWRYLPAGYLGLSLRLGSLDARLVFELRRWTLGRSVPTLVSSRLRQDCGHIPWPRCPTVLVLATWALALLS